MSKKKYRILKTVTEPRMVQIVICLHLLRGQIRRRNKPTIHLVKSDMTMYKSEPSHLYIIAVGRSSGATSSVCLPKPRPTAITPKAVYAT